MNKEDTNINCTSKGAFLFFLIILFIILSLMVIVGLHISNINNSIFVKMCSELFMVLITLFFLLSYINISINIYDNSIKYTNLFGKCKIFYKDELLGERFDGTTGRKFIFKNGSFSVYTYYKNYNEALKCIETWLKEIQK